MNRLNFSNDILEPLFYEALRIDRSHDDGYYSRFNCKIPFLNGGLFDPIGNYDWVHTDIIIPDDLFSNTNSTKEGDIGDGILDIFDRYNFTVKEDEPLEKEVAIDPELLGKAYEKFNAIRPDNYDEFRNALKSGKKGEENKFNKKFGVYYTPREIVHYMCQQSLINYLHTELNNGIVAYEQLGKDQAVMFKNEGNKGQFDLTIGHQSNPSMSKEDIEILIHIGEQVSEIEERVINKGRETETYSHKLPESIRKNAALIDQKLADITVCDPAVGSGAFPVGMMSEIVRTRNVLTPFLSLRGAQATKQSQFDGNRTPYEFKRRCIEHSLYGVDIDPGAVEIAKLRLWLSLVVDEDDIKNIKPLPNLDYRIMQGNSLISEYMGISFDANLQNDDKTSIQTTFLKDETEELIDQFQQKKDEFLNESNVTRKSKLKEEIEDLLVKLFETKLKNQKAEYFNRLKEIETKHSNWPTQKQRDEYIKQDKEKLYRESGFDLESAEKQLKEFTSGRQIKPFFLWNLYFSEVFHNKGGFDVIIANPPYVGEKGHKDIFQEIVKGNLAIFYQRRMDLFYFFFHLALNLGSHNAQIAFITTNYYPTADGARKLRHDFQHRSIIRRLINFNELKIFESALGQHNMVTILTKGNNENAFARTCITRRTGMATTEILRNVLWWHDEQTYYTSVKQIGLYEGDESYIRLTVKTESTEGPIQKILNKIDSQENTLKNICNLNQGIVTGSDKVRKKHIEKYNIDAEKGDGIFVLTKEELLSKGICLKSPHVRPWFKNSDIRKYYTSVNTNSFVLYFSDKKEKQYIEPKILEHFNFYKQLLIARLSVCKKNKFQWNIVSKWIERGEYYLLFYPRKAKVFESAKIVVPQRSKTNTFGYNEIPWYASADVYFITEKDKSVSLKYILALLNSKLFYSWLYFKGKRKGETLELYLTPLSEVPIKKIIKEYQEPFISLVDKILSFIKSDDYLESYQKRSKVKALEREIDQLVYKLYDLTPEEIEIVEGGNDHTD